MTDSSPSRVAPPAGQPAKLVSHLDSYSLLRPNLTLLQLLRRHRRLAEHRDPMFEANKAAKWVVGVSMTFAILYLILIAILLSLDANDTHGYTRLEFIMGILPFILLLDFWSRFLMQQTPAQLIRPYVLLPIPRYACIDGFILTSLFTWGNTIWGVMLLPFCIMSVVFSYGLWASLSVLLLYYIIILANSQAYSIVRTLTIGNMLWWILPLSVSALLVSPWIFGSFSTMFRLYAHLGSGLEGGNLLPHLGALLLLGVMVAVNRRLQYANVMNELGRTEKPEKVHVVKYSFLEHYGELGEYLKLEVKLLTRNKNPRKQLITATVAVVVISGLVTGTDIYDTNFMTNFWCIYNFVIYAAMILLRVMSFEGNYIDVLMVHKENILKLLTAKYYFFTLILILPFILMLPMVFMGKWEPLMLVSYALYTAGFQHFMIMQSAVYNNKAMPLNEKFIGKGGVENNYVQIAEGLAVFFVPMLLVNILEAFLAPTIAWTVMMIIGIVFVLAHRLWLRNIYNRLMARRYQNLESFHA
jgi:hypothetical protein